MLGVGQQPAARGYPCRRLKGVSGVRRRERVYEGWTADMVQRNEVGDAFVDQSVRVFIARQSGKLVLSHIRMKNLDVTMFGMI